MKFGEFIIHIIRRIKKFFFQNGGSINMKQHVFFWKTVCDMQNNIFLFAPRTKQNFFS